MNTDSLERLLAAYRSAPAEFQATQYWAAYEKEIIETVRNIDLENLRSGAYPVLDSFGFNDVTYDYYRGLKPWKKALLKFLQDRVITTRSVLPYNLSIADLRAGAFRHCQLMGQLVGAPPIDSVEASAFGRPRDLFEMSSESGQRRQYTMPFLGFYIRFCGAHRSIRFRGDETIVELGSGSGYQVEVLKKLYPGLTILCFDLPAQLHLCQQYLSRALPGAGSGQGGIVNTDETLGWKDLSSIRKGSVHFFGNWQIPLLAKFPFDVFWNAASFGEMEPEVVANYLRHVLGQASWIYLLQARHGKETSGNIHVRKPTTFDDYNRMLPGYRLQDSHDAWHAHRRLAQSGGYFEAVWKRC